MLLERLISRAVEAERTESLPGPAEMPPHSTARRLGGLEVIRGIANSPPSNCFEQTRSAPRWLPISPPKTMSPGFKISDRFTMMSATISERWRTILTAHGSPL